MRETVREIDVEGVPQSQRATVPSPLPFTGSVGAYLIVNEGARARRALQRDRSASPRVSERS